MAAGTVALIAWLFLVSILIILIAATIVALGRIAPAGEHQLSFLEAFWESLMRTLDPGTMGGDQGWSFRIVMLLVTLGGIFIVSSLIGVISTGLAGKLDQLRKGRSLVLEKDHTIIFNWSETIFDVISELVIANASRWRPYIVIMTDRDRVEVEDEIAAKVPDLRNSRIVCRSGDPTDLYDIGIVNPQTCRSVIILSPHTENPDACVIKTILALVTDPQRRETPYRIAAEIRDAANAEVARVVGGAEVQLVLVDDLISRITIQSTRQPGLSAVYTELLDFEGCEIYAVEQPALEGRPFREAQLDYDICTLIGLCDANGKVTLNPPMDRAIGPDEKLLLIAEDDVRIERRAPPEGVAETGRAPTMPADRPPERTLLIGWNRRAPMIARELSRYVRPGSQLTIAADTPEIEQEVARLALPTANLTVELKRVDTARRAEIDALEPLSYDHVLLLGYCDHLSAQAADTKTLITLLHLRAIRDAGGRSVDVVSEIVDVRNVALAELARVDDFVVSNKLVSLMLSQASENEYLEQIFQDLLHDGGSRIELHAAADYVPLGRPLTFYDVTRAASLRGETAIGHRLVANAGYSDQDSKGVILNPTKSDEVAYAEGDRIIVLTRD
jgi:voltage-gated potassium channel Kch